MGASEEWPSYRFGAEHAVRCGLPQVHYFMFSGNSADSPAGSKQAAPERYRNHWFHEGPICESLEKLDFIMVMDRAYGKIERLDRDKADGQSFVILSLCCSNGCLMVHSTLFPVMQSFLLFALLA